MDEDDLKWMKNKNKIAMCLKASFMEVFLLKPSVVGKLSLFSGMLNDALMHRAGLKG